MEIIFPHYYHEFHCIADRCPDTCCAGWEIAIDPRSLKRYRKLKGPAANRLRNSVDWKKGVFRQYRGRCAMLSDEGLCDLYTEEGPEYLCRTCRLYPRHIEEFEDSREISLCLSCIEAARIILGCQEPVRLLRVHRPGEDKDFEDFDFLLYTKLMDARELILGLLQNRQIALKTRTAMALSLAHDLQLRISRNQLFQVDSLLERYGAPGAPARFEKKLETCRMDQEEWRRQMDGLLGQLNRMEVLNSGWPAYLSQVQKGLEKNGQRDSRIASKEIWGEQLMVYFVFTYFCGGVYDGRALTRMKLAAASLLILFRLFQGIWNRDGLSLEQAADCAHRYSRELEHSDDNRLLMMEILERDYNLKTLLGLILGME